MPAAKPTFAAHSTITTVLVYETEDSDFADSAIEAFKKGRGNETRVRLGACYWPAARHRAGAAPRSLKTPAMVEGVYESVNRVKSFLR
jgi:hypothetical protein